MNEPTTVSILNAITGELIERDLTPEEIAALPAPDETSTPGPE